MKLAIEREVDVNTNIVLNDGKEFTYSHFDHKRKRTVKFVIETIERNQEKGNV
jgi:hypothetical protein